MSNLKYDFIIMFRCLVVSLETLRVLCILFCMSLSSLIHCTFAIFVQPIHAFITGKGLTKINTEDDWTIVNITVRTKVDD